MTQNNVDVVMFYTPRDTGFFAEYPMPLFGVFKKLLEQKGISSTFVQLDLLDAPEYKGIVDKSYISKLEPGSEVYSNIEQIIDKYDPKIAMYS